MISPSIAADCPNTSGAVVTVAPTISAIIRVLPDIWLSPCFGFLESPGHFQGHFFQEFGGARSIMQFRIDVVVVRPSPESAGRVENSFIEFQSATIRRPNPKWRYPVEA